MRWRERERAVRGKREKKKRVSTGFSDEAGGRRDEELMTHREGEGRQLLLCIHHEVALGRARVEPVTEVVRLLVHWYAVEEDGEFEIPALDESACGFAARGPGRGLKPKIQLRRKVRPRHKSTKPTQRRLTYLPVDDNVDFLASPRRVWYDRSVLNPRLPVPVAVPPLGGLRLRRERNEQSHYERERARHRHLRRHQVNSASTLVGTSARARLPSPLSPLPLELRFLFPSPSGVMQKSALVSRVRYTNDFYRVDFPVKMPQKNNYKVRVVEPAAWEEVAFLIS